MKMLIGFSFLILSMGCSGSSLSSSTQLQWVGQTDLTDNISLSGYNSFSPQVAMNIKGDVVIVWRQIIGTSHHIFMSEYRNAMWKHPIDISDKISADNQDAFSAQVAMSPNGDTLIVWHQSDGTNLQIFKSEYRRGAWSHPNSLADNISTDGEDAYAAQVAMASNGDSIIVWQQSDGSNEQIFKSEYRNGTWVHPTGLADNISPDGQFAYEAQVAMGTSGDTLIVWQQSNGSDDHVFKSEYRNGTWLHPDNLNDYISPDIGGGAFNVHVSMGANNEAVIVWGQSNGSNDSIFKSEYRSGAWTHPTHMLDKISLNGLNASAPKVSVGNNGNTVIVWVQYDGESDQIFMSQYINRSWVHPTEANDNISFTDGFAFAPKVSIGSNGDAIIVWEQFVGMISKIFKSEYRNGIWMHPGNSLDNISIENQNAFAAQVSVNGNNGKSVIVWQQSDGSNTQIYKSEFK